MTISQKLKFVQKVLTGVKFGQQPLENGSLIQYDGDAIAKGEVVYLTTGEGNWSVLPDGEYKTKHGDNFIITNGVVSDVKLLPDTKEADKPVKQAQAAVEIEQAKAADKDKKPAYGDVDYADPGYQSDKKARYPVDTEEHIRAAWNYIHKDKNAAQYSPDELKKVRGAIETAWRKKISPDGPPEAAKHQDLSEDGLPVAMDADSVDMSKQTMDIAGIEMPANNGTGDDVEDADSPSNEGFDDETPATVPVTVDVNDLIASALAPVCQQIADLQNVMSALQALLTTQSTQMSAVTEVVEKIANSPAGLPAEKDNFNENPFRKVPEDFKQSRLYKIATAR